MDKTTAVLVSVETGEILEEIYEGEKYKKVEHNNYAKNNVIDFNAEETFVKLYDKVVKLLMESLTATEFVLAISLCQFVCYRDCVLRIGGHNNGKIMNTNDIAEQLNMSPSTVRRLMPGLKEKGIIIKIDVGTILEDKKNNKVIQYIVNPYIYNRGKDVSKWVINLFDKSGWREKINTV